MAYEDAQVTGKAAGMPTCPFCGDNDSRYTLATGERACSLCAMGRGLAVRDSDVPQLLHDVDNLLTSLSTLMGQALGQATISAQNAAATYAATIRSKIGRAK